MVKSQYRIDRLLLKWLKYNRMGLLLFNEKLESLFYNTLYKNTGLNWQIIINLEIVLFFTVLYYYNLILFL